MKPGPELDALIAEKVMGWKLCQVFHGRKSWFSSERGIMYTADDRIEKLSDQRTVMPWRPSTEILCAWEVVERIKDMKPKDTFSLEWFNGNWAADFAYGDYDDYNKGECVPTAPLAICLLALKVMK